MDDRLMLPISHTPRAQNCRLTGQPYHGHLSRRRIVHRLMMTISRIPRSHLRGGGVGQKRLPFEALAFTPRK